MPFLRPFATLSQLVLPNGGHAQTSSKPEESLPDKMSDLAAKSLLNPPAVLDKPSDQA